MTLSIVTWNVNSVRLRLPGARRLVRRFAPDVLCLQETKATDEVFPRQAFATMGFEHALLRGMKGYNGVAILSRQPFEVAEAQPWGGGGDCRHAVVQLAGGIELHNVYVPAGGDIPDPTLNPKFAHKLRFIDDMTRWFARHRSGRDPMILVGDLNVAPLEADVWSHRQLLTVVSHTPIEVEHLARLGAAAEWTDAVRHFITPEQKLYSWWSYRNRDWAASDRGRRLDHVWVTPALVDRLKSAQILREMRGWVRPSDHVPVIVTLD